MRRRLMEILQEMVSFVDSSTITAYSNVEGWQLDEEGIHKITLSGFVYTPIGAFKFQVIFKVKLGEGEENPSGVATIFCPESVVNGVGVLVKAIRESSPDWVEMIQGQDLRNSSRSS